MLKPQNHIEKELYELWKEVLEIDEFSLNENFYTLGGHSITMIKLLALMEKRMNVKLSYSDFIQNPTVLQNAALIEKKKSEAKPQVVYPNIIVEKDKEYDAFELTDIQMAYLVGRNAALKSGGISTHMYTEVKTELDLSKFNIALNKAILRHGMLRAVILKTGNFTSWNVTSCYFKNR
ncbi:hypothetical protein DXC31_19115 [Mediterraneibacter gnavus]|uniref:Carrier domain-containing protein n=1 Tax=Mediterraneibacter gnavus TaxID=33038 RepID=A0A3E4UML8_MEDGN|nr:hypothetical protein DXC31_19115 [Mediterraneibacter gnavus]